MGCCGGHFEMHDERRRPSHAGGHHDHGQAGATPASAATSGADGAVSEPSVNRWIAPFVFGVAVAILYFIFR